MSCSDMILLKLQETRMFDWGTLSVTQMGIPSTKWKELLVGVRQLPNAKDKLAVYVDNGLSSTLVGPP